MSERNLQFPTYFPHFVGFRLIAIEFQNIFSTGEVYRGKLIEAEDNMNCQMTQITVTYRDGRMATLENVYIRGSKIRFLILPDMLKNAPMFKNKSGNKSGTAGRGKSAILRAQGESTHPKFDAPLTCFALF